MVSRKDDVSSFFAKIRTKYVTVTNRPHGFMRTSSNARAFYFITFIDDCSRWCEIYFMKTKDEALEAFKKYKLYAERKTGAQLQFLQSDNEGEYINKTFDAYLEQFGIK